MAERGAAAPNAEGEPTGAEDRSGAVPRLPFVGLTGGIAAGKSEALAALDRLGAATLSSDDVVHELLATEEVRDLLTRRFGPGVAPEGRVDRAAVARAVFERPEEREWLEGILWPRVGERIAAWREELEARQPRPRAAVVEVPLLFEANMEDVFDATVAVVAEDSLRERRAAARGHEALETRTGRQLGQAEKAQRADFAVENDGAIADLEDKMSHLLEAIRR